MSPTPVSPSARGGDTLRLVALLDGEEVGKVFQARNGRLRFVYDEEWRVSADGYALSLSLPLAAREHRHDVVSAFLWGLLPDSSRALDNYGRLFGVSPANPVALLAEIGADCAGAVQFAPPERVDALLGAATLRRSEVDWLDENEIADELRIVREQGIPGTSRRTVGQFSLAGAQPKIALFEEGGRWGRPTGRTPTNRILKPPSRDFPGFAENEHFCLGLAGTLGLGAVQSRVMRFAGEVAIVVDRFDRLKRRNVYHRVHQEDFCQALGVMPTRKYENEGGPGLRDIVVILRDSSQRPEEDVDRFLRAMALNWVIAATDGHAKNYALLHGPDGATRLAPFYDVASYLPYTHPSLHRVKLAMKIGSQYLVRRINRRSWEASARSLSLPEGQLLERVNDLVRRVAGAVELERERAIDVGLDASVIHTLADRIRARVASCLSALQPHSSSIPAA